MIIQKKHKIPYVPNIPIPPGETLQEVLEDKGMTQAELARRLNRPLKTVNEIIKGKAAITPETALQLERVLDISAHFWNNLETSYRELMGRLQMEKVYIAQVEEAQKYPYKEMAKWGWVSDTKDSLEKVKNLLSFFAVTSFQNIIEEQQLKGVFRISLKQKYSIPSIIAWLRKGAIDSKFIETKSFNIEKLENLLSSARSLTIIDDPQEFMPKLVNLLADCGIAFVVTPNLLNAPVNGSTRWIKPDKALIQLSIRYKFSDIFWFTLFHEIGHLLLDKKRDFNIDLIDNIIQKEKEGRADRFACDVLIPPDHYKILKHDLEYRKDFSNVYLTIKSFAAKLSIHPGIVTGRLQHDGLLPMNMNRLRIRFEWGK